MLLYSHPKGMVSFSLFMGLPGSYLEVLYVILKHREICSQEGAVWWYCLLPSVLHSELLCAKY